MHKIAVIGLGNVGTTVAHMLLMAGLVDELVLIDKNEKKVAAEYNDFADAFPRTAHSAVIKQNDYRELADTDIIITAFGDIEATNRTGGPLCRVADQQAECPRAGRKDQGEWLQRYLDQHLQPM